jgi:prepilin-type N-terminal cleavage/methylation domain-containing protein
LPKTIMKNAYKQKRQQGFTIIEILIVLAIAAVILLIVFLAVPSLQRNSRNTQRKNDVSTLLGGMSEFASNNAGAFPTTWAAGQLTGAAGTTPAGANLGYYVPPIAAPVISGGAHAALTTDIMLVQTGATCSGTPARSIAVLYMVEGSGGLVAACQQS